MTISTRLKPLLVLGILTALVGCRLQVIAPLGGNVTWEGGECLAGETGSICVIDIASADFSETFTAIASPGYEFKGWEFRYRQTANPLNPQDAPCDDSVVGGPEECTLSFSRIPQLIAIPALAEIYFSTDLSEGYLTPVYLRLAVDTDTDGDGDGDGIGDEADQCLETPTNEPVNNVGCPAVDGDLDNDGVADSEDNCPSISNTPQLNTDDDTLGDACDPDKDGDGVLNNNDLYPLISLSGLLDTDGDGTPNVCDAACETAGMEQDVCHIEDGDDSRQLASDCYPVIVNYALPDIILGDPVCPVGSYATIDTDDDDILDDGCINPTYAVQNPPYYLDRVYADLEFPIQNITIPEAKILAMPFQTLDWDGYVGKLQFLVPTAQAGAVATVWVSLAKGGAPIEAKCTQGPASENYALLYTTYASSICSLEPDSDYYLNIAHTVPGTDTLEPLQISSVMKRSIFHQVLPPTSLGF